MKYYEDTFDDNGGVHIYSGIPNKAFYLAAVDFSGYSWQKAGKIWWDTLQSGLVDSDCSFADFAKATIAVAKKSIDEDSSMIVAKAWKAVGVISDKEDASGWVGRVMESCKLF